ncbi:HAD superfamily hydrolase (TIGR01509 family) [Rhodococcus sp. 27YEA15]|uniref:HAD family hydrolase n=1 Tax=Rhodococcus sp. 27YEA15 TaxID=3156259 RepID=UPI003C7D6F79
MLQAVFWDMDGTVVDTEPNWFAAETALLSRFGVEWTHQQSVALVGSALEDAAAVLRAAGAELTVREIIDELVAALVIAVNAEVQWRPGARELLAQLRAEEIDCVLVTMSEAPLAAAVVDQLPAGTFTDVISGDMVEHGKPNPEPYLLAAQRLSESGRPVSMDRVVAIEDSIPGLASATASGAVVVGVANLVPLPSDPAIVPWETLAGKSVDDLRVLVNRRVGSSA